MKKSFLLLIACAAMVTANAQQSNSVFPHPSLASNPNTLNGSSLHSARTTTTVYNYDELMENVLPTDTFFYYNANAVAGSTDSGYLFGNSAYGITEFAERYDFNGADSMIKVLGVASVFVGTVSPTSTKVCTFKMWDVAAPTVSSATVTYSGFPGTQDDSVNVTYLNLGVIAPGGSITGLTPGYFADSATNPYRTTSFFVGIDLEYNWAAEGGDTISTFASDYRHSAVYTAASGDTTVNDVNAVYWNLAGGWLDLGWDIGYNTDFFIFPIIDASMSSSLSVTGITNKNFTFFGNYPNPCVNSTNVKFSLAVNSDVIITVADMSGRTVNTINQTNLSVGAHIVPIETSSLPSGNYICTIRVLAGGGIASKFTVAK